jgi:hypothetical protein
MSTYQSTACLYRGKDYVGCVIGRWTVLGYASGGHHPRWLCRCICGTEKTVIRDELVKGASQSCGCSLLTHGKTLTPEYRVWTNMIQRCENPSQEAYKNYGARGIIVCKRWRESFEAFLADMGPRPSPEHSLERVRNDGDYVPANCKWATNAEQNSNRRNSVFLEYQGERLHLAEWARRKGMSEASLAGRLRRGWSVAEAIERPLRPDRRRKSNP